MFFEMPALSDSPYNNFPNNATAFEPQLFPCADHPLDPASYLQQASAELMGHPRNISDLLAEIFELPDADDDSDDGSATAHPAPTAELARLHLDDHEHTAKKTAKKK